MRETRKADINALNICNSTKASAIKENGLRSDPIYSTPGKKDHLYVT